MSDVCLKCGFDYDSQMLSVQNLRSQLTQAHAEAAVMRAALQKVWDSRPTLPVLTVEAALSSSCDPKSWKDDYRALTTRVKQLESSERHMNYCRLAESIKSLQAQLAKCREALESCRWTEYPIAQHYDGVKVDLALSQIQTMSRQDKCKLCGNMIFESCEVKSETKHC
jgi:hypothetical protein